MSFVIGYITFNSAIIVSDGRARGANNVVVSEHYNKTKRINDKVIIGFSGESALCEVAIRSLYAPVPINSVSINPVLNWTVTEVSNCLCSFLKNLKLEQHRKCNFIVAGLNSSHLAELDVFGSSSTFQIEKHIPSPSAIYYVTLSPDGVDGNKIVQNRLKNGQHSFVVDNLKDAVSDVAKINQSVNTNYYAEVLSL